MTAAEMTPKAYCDLRKRVDRMAQMNGLNAPNIMLKNELDKIKRDLESLAGHEIDDWYKRDNMIVNQASDNCWAQPEYQELFELQETASDKVWHELDEKINKMFDDEIDSLEAKFAEVATDKLEHELRKDFCERFRIGGK